MTICQKNDCVGCGACALACPRGAILLKENHEGFIYPKVISSQCVKCNKCRKVCPVMTDNVPLRNRHAEYYGGSNKDFSEARKSTSGGVAHAIAQQVIREGGVVYGSAFTELPSVEHIRVDVDELLTKIQGSKYLESNVAKVFPLVRKDLEKGKKVLFVGLPCHVAALYGYLGGASQGLYTIDLICHGKPPQKLFARWFSELQNRVRQRIVGYWFRNKTNCDWSSSASYQHKYITSGGAIHFVPEKDNWYCNYFLGSAVFRTSCYRCKFAQLPRVGDITLGDLWNWKRIGCLEKYSINGLSLISVQSDSGKSILMRSSLDVRPISSDKAIGCSYGLTHHSHMNIYRRFVFKYVYTPPGIRKICDFLLFGAGMLIRRFRRSA